MEPKCKCGAKSTSTAAGIYRDTFSLNGKLVYATCQCGKVVVDKRPHHSNTITFDECETPIYSIK